MEKNGQERFQESTWKIFSDPSITSIVIEPTIEVIEIQPKINKIKFSSGLVGKATLNQIVIQTATSQCARLEQRTIGSCLKIVPVWEKIRIRPVIAEIRLNSNVRRIVCFIQFYIFKHRSRSLFSLGNIRGVKIHCLLSFWPLYLSHCHHGMEWKQGDDKIYNEYISWSDLPCYNLF